MQSILFCTLIFLYSCSGVNTSPRFVKPVKLNKGQHSSESKAYMISTQGFYSTQAGKKIFELGGNAADAAAAISFVISVERPQSTGIGGGGFLLYKQSENDVPVSYDFREMAPLKSHSKMYLNSKGDEIKNKSLVGINAGGIPGLVAGVFEFHKKFGKLPWKVILGPAIELAQNGFKIYPGLAKALIYKEKDLAKFKASREIFFHKNGKILKEGDLLIQTDLAKSLKLIQKTGKKAFYNGLIANAFVRESKKRKGLFTYKDFKNYQVKIRKPVHGKVGEYDIYSMGPPSSGGIHILQILNTLESLPLKKWGVHNPKTIHHTASAMQQAFADRARYLGDSDFVKVPVKELISKSYAKKIRDSIDFDRAKLSSQIMPGKFDGYESDETTHFSVMDQEGNIVSSTQTINGWFGSSLVIPGTGILLNNEMDDFATKVGARNLFGAVGGKNNLVKAKKRPLSSMSPTIILKNTKPVLAIGSPSGTRILTCVAQVILNYIIHGYSLEEASSLVRYHHQWYPDEIRTGEVGLPMKTEEELKKMGYKINRKNLGCRVQAISWENGTLKGVSDFRGQGQSYGP